MSPKVILKLISYTQTLTCFLTPAPVLAAVTSVSAALDHGRLACCVASTSCRTCPAHFCVEMWRSLREVGSRASCSAWSITWGTMRATLDERLLMVLWGQGTVIALHIRIAGNFRGGGAKYSWLSSPRILFPPEITRVVYVRW